MGAGGTTKTPARPSFALTETAPGLDPRIHAYRDDIADIALADRISLPHYVAPVMRQVGLAIADLRTDPSDASELGSQLLHGEPFALLDTVEDWAWGYGQHDHFVGFIRKTTLIRPQPATHIVTALSSAVEPANANEASTTLFMGSRLSGKPEDDRLIMPNGSIALTDARPIDARADDPIAIAEMFIEAPYLLGGRSVAGIDCSGLVQISLAMAGHRVERDSDLQQASIGDALPVNADLRRGDLVFFPEHVGMMIDGETLIHASGHNGRVCTEPLADVAARIGEIHEIAILARRRIAG
ncbi:MAG: NlpC/P60 family protein [Pseudomonadota bacterium]